MKEKKDVINKIRKNKKEEIVDANVEGKRNKLGYIIICAIMVILLCGLIYYMNNKKDASYKSDTDKFITEYEELNGKTNDAGKEHKSLDLNTNVEIEYATYDKVFELLDKGTGVIYFGFPECPWCRALLPELLSVSESVGVEKIYYMNNREDRDTLSLDEDKNIVVEKEGTEEYKKLVEKLNDYLGEYEGLNDKTIKRLYFPTVVFLKDGKVVDIHIGTLDSQEDPRVEFSEEEKSELDKLLEEKFNKVIMCDGSC